MWATATSDDVARMAGVSTATVSRALRGVDGVNGRTRDRVLAAAHHLGYVSSPAASRLAGGRTATIAVVVPFITRWFFSEVISGAEEVLRGHGLDLLLYNLGHVEGRERYFSGEALQQRADAVLVLCLPLSDLELEALGGARMPVVLVGTDIERCPSVRIDDVAGGRTAVQHLVNLGHKRIALISGTPGDPMGFTSAFDRRRGYRETLQSAGLEVDPSLDVPGDFTVEGGEMAMARLLSHPRPPTAVFAESDEMAFGALRTLQRAGLSAPRDISLIGFDDHQLADLMNLTTIAQPVREQGARAAQMLLEVLDGHGGEHRVTLPTRLVVRGTTGPERRARADGEIRDGSPALRSDAVQFGQLVVGDGERGAGDVLAQVRDG